MKRYSNPHHTAIGIANGPDVHYATRYTLNGTVTCTRCKHDLLLHQARFARLKTNVESSATTYTGKW